MTPLARKKSLLSKTLLQLIELVINEYCRHLCACGWWEVRLPPNLAPACGAAMVVGRESTCQQVLSPDWCLFSLPERRQCSAAQAASPYCISFPLEKGQECSFGPFCRGEGTTCTPARKGNPTQLLLLRKDWELGQTFHTWVIKIRLLHPYVSFHFKSTAWLTFLFCLLGTPLMGECFHLPCGFDSGPCT